MVIIMQTSKVKRLGSGYSSIYKTSEWQQEQHDFEIRLGKYAYTHPKSHEAVNKGLSRMKNILWAYYHDQFVNLGKKEFFLRAFTKDDPSMAGQVGRMVGEEIFKIIGDNFTQKIDKTLSGSSSNLREKMTAFYNASGISSDASNQSINFKNIMQKIVTSNSRTSNYLINKLGLDKNSVDEAIRHNSKNIFKAGLSSGLHNLFKGPDVYGKYGMNFKSKDKDDNDLKFKYTNMDDKKKNIRNPFNNPLPLSQRELNFYNSTHFPKFEKPNMLFYTMLTILAQKTDALEPYIDKEITEENHYTISKNGFRLTENGTSFTTTKLLNTAKWLGLSMQDLLNFRLALMGWLLPDGDHSLYEILYSSHAAGIRGKNEDLTDVASMDETIDPLTTDEIRHKCGTEYTNTIFIETTITKDKVKKRKYKNMLHKHLLPIEIVYYNRNDLKLNNKMPDETKSELTQGTKIYMKLPELPGPHRQALTAYKSPAHLLINHSLVFNNFRFIAKIQQYNYLYNNLKAQIYNHLLSEFKQSFKIPHSLNEYLEINGLPSPKEDSIYNNLSPLLHEYSSCINITSNTIKDYILNNIPDFTNLIHNKDENAHPKTIKLYKEINTLLKSYSKKRAQYIINDAGLSTFGWRMDKLLDDTYATANMLQDYLRSAPKYNGHVYSGQKMLLSYYLGSTITTSMFTSTSKKKETAADYYKGAILVFDLHNTGVDIGDKLDQVLIPPGCKFKVKKVTTTPENGDEVAVDKDKPTGKPVNYVYLEEI